MLSHGDFYRDAYESAVRALPGAPDAPIPPVDRAGESEAAVDEPRRDAGPEADQPPRRAA